MAQKTITVDGQKVTIKSQIRTYMGNRNGYYVFVNGKRYHVASLYREEAEKIALERWQKEQA